MKIIKTITRCFKVNFIKKIKVAVLSLFLPLSLYAGGSLPNVAGDFPKGTPSERVYIVGHQVVVGINHSLGKAQVVTERDFGGKPYKELHGVSYLSMSGTNYNIDLALLDIRYDTKMACDVVGLRLHRLKIYKVYSINNCQELGINKMVRLINEKFEDN